MRRVPVSRYGLVGPLVLLAVGALAAGERAAGTVASLSGSATVARTGLAKPANLAVRDDLFVRDRITTGKESLIRVLLGGRTTVTARELSVVTLTDTADRARVGLDAGGAALDVAPVRAASARPIEVRTPNAIAAVRGTVLTVEVLRLSGRGATFVTTVSVFTGAVDVMASRVPSPKRVRVNAGQSVVVTGDVVGPVRPIDGVTARRLVADFALTGPGTRPLPGATARPPDQPGGVAGVGIAGPGAPGTVPSAGGPAGRAVGSGGPGVPSATAGAPAATGLAPATSSSVMAPVPGFGGPAVSTTLPGTPAPPSPGSSPGGSGGAAGSGGTATIGTGSAAPSSGVASGGSTGSATAAGTGSTAGTGGSAPAYSPAPAAPPSPVTVGPAAAVAATPPTAGSPPVVTAPEYPGSPPGVLRGVQPPPGQPAGQGGGSGSGGQGQVVNPGLFQPQPLHQVIKGLNPNNPPPIK